jgi:hypothetical protein
MRFSLYLLGVQQTFLQIILYTHLDISLTLIGDVTGLRRVVIKADMGYRSERRGDRAPQRAYCSRRWLRVRDAA